ncbi:MAG TPA: GreA/GreB family elongation factor [Candidatus Limnocylindrales bacterium]|nr:GreA/GreB family elongation factor [Candidatus Limnocylindrales bacterium]
MTEPLSLLAPIPMTAAAADSLRREIASLARELDGRRVAGDANAPISIDRARSARTLARLRDLLDAAAVEDRADVAVVGRRVTIHDESEEASPGAGGNPVPMTFSLVLPGDGDPSLGWVSIESPLGAAVAGRRPGDRTRVVAPGGDWHAAIVSVE